MFYEERVVLLKEPGRLIVSKGIHFQKTTP